MLVEKPENPEQGIYESHLLCLKRGVDSGAARILVFEDDVVFRGFSAARLAACVAFLRAQPDWDAFFLGCMAQRLHKVPGVPIAWIRYRNLTHALALSRPIATRILADHPWRGLAYDDFLRQLNSPRMFVACPACAFQSDSPSDNDALLHLERWWRRLGGLLFLQWLAQFWRRFFWPLALGQAALLCALLWLLWHAVR